MTGVDDRGSILVEIPVHVATGVSDWLAGLLLSDVLDTANPLVALAVLCDEALQGRIADQEAVS